MKQYIDKGMVIAEIEKRISLFQKEKKTEKWSAGASQMNVVSLGARITMLEEIFSFLKTLEVKEVKEEPESIWHDANKQPTTYRKYLVRYSDGRVSGSWERHDNGFIPWKDVIKEHGFTHWCYVEDLIKL